MDYEELIDRLPKEDRIAIDKFESANLLLDEVFYLLRDAIALAQIKESDDKLVLLKEKIGKYFGNTFENKCPNCGNHKPKYMLYDGAGIECGYVCDNCVEDKKSKYDPSVFKQDTTDYRRRAMECGESLEPDE